MRLVLAAMPWQAIHRPSLPVGLLHRLVREQCPEIEVAEYHGGIRWAEYMLADGELAPADYTKVSDNGVFQGLGDLIFSGSLYDDLGWRADELREIAKSYGFETATVMRMRALTTGFIESAVTEVLASEPDVVGFTSTFMQNVPRARSPAEGTAPRTAGGLRRSQLRRSDGPRAAPQPPVRRLRRARRRRGGLPSAPRPDHLRRGRL
jgi:hypothetical protein